MTKYHLLALVLGMALVVPMQGTIIIETGNIPQTDENILFNDPSLTLTGNLVQGITNQSSNIVQFTSTDDLVAPSGGQARIEGTGLFTNFVFSVPDQYFTSYIFNLSTVDNESGLVTIAALDDSGITFSLTDSPLGAGGNFFTVTAIDGQLISNVSVTSSVALENVAQNRVGGITAGPSEVIPEPATYVLFGAGLAVVALVRRRRSA